MYIYYKDRIKKGYTLAELLTVVAIIVVLCAISAVGVVNYYNYLQQMEVDQTAKEIYIAAQNHLTYANTTGQLTDDSNLGLRMDRKPSDMSDDEWEKNKESYYYLVYNQDNKNSLEDTILKDILPYGSIDAVVRESGSYIIEYNIKTATIYGVFYAKEGKLTWADENNELLPGEKYRGKPKNRMKYGSERFNLGYYGGSGVSLPVLEEIKKPDIEIINGEKLSVKITDNNKIKTIISLEVVGEKSRKKKTIDLPISEVARRVRKKNSRFKNWEVTKTDKKTVYNLTIDDINTKGGHFTEIFDKFSPGENIIVTAKCVGKDTLTPIVKSKSKTTNSLFKSVTEDTANISYIRHLENLDPVISGLKINIKHASQQNDLGYSLNTVYNRNGNIAIVSSFYGINNNELLSYNGNKFKIENLKIKGQKNAGLFSIVENNGDLTISNLELKNPIIKGERTAGGFVGLVKGKITIKDSSVKGKDSSIFGEGSNPAAGGIIGECGDGSKLKAENTYSTALVSILANKVDDDSKRYTWAGGFIGRVYYLKEGSIIENCYVGGRTENGGEYNEDACNVTGVIRNGRIGNVGGFIGKINEYSIHKTMVIKNCYTTASVSAEGNGQINVGGFIGHANNTRLESSYATGLVKSSKKKNCATFLGKEDKNVEGNGNNHILIGINPSTVRIVGNRDNSELASLATVEKIRGKKPVCKLAHPYDTKLKKNEFKLRTVVGNTHYGDWPEASTNITITKNIEGDMVNHETLTNNKMYFTMINTTTHKRYKTDYDSFVKNPDGSYTSSFALPAEDLTPKAKYTFNETREGVDGAYGEKIFSVIKNGKEIAKGIKTVAFEIEKDDKIEIKVENKYSKLLKVRFKYKDLASGILNEIETKNCKLNGSVTPPSEASVKVPNGKVFNGVWVLEGNENIRINSEGYILDGSGNPTTKYILKQDTSFIAEFENIPTITLKYGIVKNGKIMQIVEGTNYQVKKGTSFKATIDIKKALTSKHKFLKVLENGIQVNSGISVKDKQLKFDINNIQRDHTYQVIVEGTDVTYGVKYVFLNSQGNSINNLSYSDNGQEIDVEGVRYKGAIIDSKMSIEGIVGMLTNVERKNLPQPPSGFNEPTWSNVKVKKSGTYVYAIYSRKKYDVNYNLDGGRSSEGNILILRSQAEYGSPLELEKEPSKKGCNFVGWKVNNKVYGAKEVITMPNEPINIKAVWEEEKVANYTIEYYLQKVSDRPYLSNNEKTYDFYSSEVFSGKVGTKPILSFKDSSELFNEEASYFEYNKINTENGLNNTIIKSDGSTIVKVYFDREVITINFMYDNEPNSEEIANRAAKEYGGVVGSGYKFMDQSNPKKNREYMGWFYWKNKKYIKINEDTVLPDNEPVYFRYHWLGETYVETTFKKYKSHIWKWDKVEGNLGYWRFGYYEKTGIMNNVVYKGLYGAPFIQEGSDYYNFKWNDKKNWISHFGALFNLTPEEITYYDSFIIPKGEGNEIILHANEKKDGDYKIVQYIQDLKNPDKWIKKIETGSEKTFEYTFINLFSGFTVGKYRYLNGDEHIVSAGDKIRVGSSWGDFDDVVEIFNYRNKYNLKFKNVKNFDDKKIYYGSIIKNNLSNPQENNIPDNIDKDFLFDGWYDSMSEDETQRIDNKVTMPPHSFIAFAHWRAPKYTININYKNNPSESTWKTKVVEVDKYDTSEDDENLRSALQEAQKVNNANYSFEHWYYDDRFDQPFNEGDPIIENRDLYAEYTQKAGVKEIKVRSICGSDSHGDTIYLQVDENGDVEYEADGKTAKTTTDALNPNSYYTIKGEIGKTITLIPRMVFGYKPQKDSIVVDLSEETDEVEIHYVPVNTWNYIIECAWDNKLMQRNEFLTYFERRIEYAPKFNGFTLKPREEKFAVLDMKNKKHKFNYDIDEDYQYEITGDYDFSSDNYAVANYDGKPHKLTIREKEMNTSPKDVEVVVTYYKAEDNTKISTPIEAGEYYAVVEVSLKNTKIWNAQIELDIQ